VSNFTAKQEAIIDIFFRTGRLTHQQTAVILPALIRWIFKEKPDQKKELVRRYGPEPETVLSGFGSDILNDSRDAEILMETLMSTIRQRH